MSMSTTTVSGSMLFIILLAATGAPSLLAAEYAPPAQRSRAEVNAILAKAPPPEAEAAKPLHVILVASKKDHGPNEHDYPLWQKRWKVLLGGKGPDDEPKVNCFRPEPEGGADAACAGSPGVTVDTATDWPTKEQLAKADLVVVFSKAQWTPERLADAKGLLARGGGLVIVHVAVWQKSKPLADLVGMAAGDSTKYRHGEVDLAVTDTNHPITRGFPETVRLLDETYYHFQGDPGRLTVLATCQERIEKDKPETRPEPMFWCREEGKGRVFTCVPGHFMWTFDDPLLRLLLLRGMAWSAGGSPYRLDALATRGAVLGE
ncbi:MAG: ThuA domain-containing protein [Planctomycetes bacterium]|nr:ThuA domain-containing protein [Planctomycetota bacterium]